MNSRCIDYSSSNSMSTTVYTPTTSHYLFPECLAVQVILIHLARSSCPLSGSDCNVDRDGNEQEYAVDDAGRQGRGHWGREDGETLQVKAEGRRGIHMYMYN